MMSSNLADLTSHKFIGHSRFIIADSRICNQFEPRNTLLGTNNDKVTLKVQYSKIRCQTSSPDPGKRKIDGCKLLSNKDFNWKRKSQINSDCSFSSPEPLQGAESEYEVFLSFRGTDVRKGFIDCLYVSLVDAGIHAYRDDEELQVGESISKELLQAISHSKICIPIFSKDYASSHWCLRELAQMVECRKSTGLVIMPVFYDVEPSEVKLHGGCGSYIEALFRHSEKYKPTLVTQWEEALREVGRIKGLELEKATNGHEGKLIEIIVRKVLISLKTHHLNVTDRLVAIDDHVKKLMSLLNVGSKEVRIVGIHGMGGIGKTTLAKVVFNLLSDRFEYCSFLADIRASEHKGLEYLQNQLIANILRRRSPEITNLDEGINIIKHRLSGKNVLILLDDVDKISQLDALVGKKSWFGPGSRIIITTRNKDVLNVPLVDWKYELTTMDADQSLNLFSRHAFRRDYPPNDYLTFSRKAVEIVGGLPLALENIGSFLSAKKKEVWDSTLKKLEKVSPKEVQNKLKISYDALDTTQKQIFLDIACQFIGFDKRIVVHMWDDTDLFPEEAIEVLQLMSLIKIGDNNKLWMHDQLRDLGRQIVHQESATEPGKRSRLWDHKEALMTLTENKGTETIEALCLKFDRISQHYFTGDEFTNLPNLRFLQVNGVALAGNFKNLLSQLRWLCWHYCPLDFLAYNFYLPKMVILDLSWSKISEKWRGWRQIKKLKNLKVLNLTRCTNLFRHPDLSNYTLLERVIFEGCENLIEIDSTIGGLKNLVLLNIRECCSIQKLPDELYSLNALTELLIDGTAIKEISVSPGCMKSLQILSARDCKNLTKIDSSIQNLESLTELSLDNASITHLPDCIGTLTKLKRLSISGCRSINILPDNIGQLESLVELDLSNTGLMELPDSIKSLKNLRLLRLDGNKIERMPSVIGMLRKLEEIHTNGCDFEGSIPGEIGNLLLLRVLSLSENHICSLPSSICNLSRLQSLDMEMCKELQGLPELPSSLISLRVGSQSLKTIPNLINLKQLNLSDDSHLHGFPTNDSTKLVQGPSPSWIGMLTKLETLQLSFSTITTLPENLGSLSRLKKLVLSCVNLQCSPQLPSRLSTLYIRNCKSLTKLSNISGLRSLLELEILQSALSEIEGLEGLEMLEFFDVIDCKVRRLDGLEHLKSLRHLVLSNCKFLEELPNLMNLRKLKEFEVRDCQKLPEIQGLNKLESLEEFHISDCVSIESLPDLSDLKLLQVLEIRNCSKIVSIQGLERMESLEELLISECSSFERLPDLSNLKKLKVLEIESCKNLGNIKGLDQLMSLNKLRIISCKPMDKLPALPGLPFLHFDVMTWLARDHTVPSDTKALTTVSLLWPKLLQNDMQWASVHFSMLHQIGDAEFAKEPMMEVVYQLQIRVQIPSHLVHKHNQLSFNYFGSKVQITVKSNE